MIAPLPPLEEVLRQSGMTYDQCVAALLEAGYPPFYARNIAGIASGRSDGDVIRPRRRRKAALAKSGAGKVPRGATV